MKLHIPQKGEQKQLVEMCRTNAAEALAQATGRTTGRETSALDELRKLLSGHLCRCTGYENILRAVKKTMYKRLGKPMPEAE